MAEFICNEPARGGYPHASILGLPGLERMRRMVRGRIPKAPMQHLFGLRPVEAGVGTCTTLTPASEWLQASHGAYTGGIGALVADAALGGAVGTGMDPWQIVATSQLCLNFLRPAGPWSGRLTARGRLIHTTPTVGLSEVHVEDGEGRLLCHGTSRCFLQRMPPPDDLEPDPGEASEPTYSTPDPYLRPVAGSLELAEVWENISGAEFVHGFISGKFAPSPINFLLGHMIRSLDEHGVTGVMPAHEWLCSSDARVYGGVTANFAHDVMSAAVQSQLPKATGFATLDLTVNFLRPIAADGRDLVAHARVVHRGRSLAVATTEVTNADGKIVATASSSWIILSGRAFPGKPEFAREFPDAAE